MHAWRNVRDDNTANNPRRRAIIPVRFKILHSPGRRSLDRVERVLLADEFFELRFAAIELMRQIETPPL
jgi:hypothetical protein